jgi:hypothetical protein
MMGHDDDRAARASAQASVNETRAKPEAEFRSEVDEIDAELRGPVNCWLNNNQQTRYARLLVLARQGEAAQRVMNVDVEQRSAAQQMQQAANVPIYDRPPRTPEDFAERNRPGSAFGLP